MFFNIRVKETSQHLIAEQDHFTRMDVTIVSAIQRKKVTTKKVMMVINGTLFTVTPSHTYVHAGEMYALIPGKNIDFNRYERLHCQ